MTPNHHPGSELLMDYAAGAAPEPVALLVATHLSLCPTCRAVARRLDAVGGAMLAALPPASVSPNALATALARIARDAPDEAPRPAPAISSALPAPLRAYVPEGVAALPWREVVRGVAEATLECNGAAGHKASLLRIAGGRAIPRHTHRGDEMLLVLDGSFHDELGRYARGDVAVSDATVEHRPVADSGRDCLCLVVQDAPIRLTGFFARVLNPFLRH